jgi:hypothetical protein
MSANLVFATAQRRRRHALAAVAGALVLCACGGGGQGTEFETQAISAPLALYPEPVPPLLADDGSVMPSVPDALPADPGASTRRGRYALRQQAEMLTQALSGGVLWVDVSCCHVDASDDADATRQALQNSAVPDSTPVFVTGADARLAAAVANVLDDAGLRVFLVTR